MKAEFNLHINWSARYKLFGHPFGHSFVSLGIFTQMNFAHFFFLFLLSVRLKWKFHWNIFHTPLSHDSYPDIFVHKYHINVATHTHVHINSQMVSHKFMPLFKWKALLLFQTVQSIKIMDHFDWQKRSQQSKKAHSLANRNSWTIFIKKLAIKSETYTKVKNSVDKPNGISNNIQIKYYNKSYSPTKRTSSLDFF